MDKLKMQSENLVDENIEKIATLFPNCVTEGKDENGKLVKLVDFDLLKQELSNAVIEGNDERYTLNWAGKRQAILTANAPITKTLRPSKSESVDFDNTKNLYIEGDNLDVLKLLRETYLHKIELIYIDPPYNTGHDFVYNDDFSTTADEYLKNSKSLDEQGNQLFQNTDSNGRYHSDWLSMMFSRLKIAKDLLTNDGVIFISIDDNEQHNLRKICDEIFGSSNFIGNIIQNKGNAQNDAKNLQKNHEFILVYTATQQIDENGQTKAILSCGTTEVKDIMNDEFGFYYRGSGIVTGGEGGTLNKRPNLGYTIYYNPTTNDAIAVCDYDVEKAKVSNNEAEIYKDNAELINKGYEKIRAPKKDTKLGVWTWSLDKFNSEKNQLSINKTKTGYSIYKKVYVDPKEVYIKDNKSYIDIKKESPSKSILDYSTASGSAVLTNLLGARIFSNPKNIDLLKYLISLYHKKEFTVMDFFSGSASTAQAVLELNATGDKNIKFILVQLPEETEESNEFKTICEIGKERIRKVGSSLIKENNHLDIGFRDFKLDNSCMKDVYYNPADMTQSLLAGLEDNIKEDRTPEDLLFQVMLDMGVMLSSDIKTLDINGKKVFNVNDGNLVCCFDKNLKEDVVKEIAKMQPLYAVFRDASMNTDSVNVNFDQIFETYSPTTTRKVL